jgi:membrane associated rhomboid family serine protease
MVEFRPGGFRVLPTVIKNLIIINVLVFLAQMAFDPTGYGKMSQLLALHDVRSVYFKPHQLITHLFMHGSVTHIFFNMFALWMFGSTLENVWGPKRFLIFYILCGLGAAFLHLATLYVEYAPIVRLVETYPIEQQTELLYAVDYKINTPTLGASGAVFGCLAAFGYLFPNSLIYLYFLFPMKAKWLVILYAGVELWLGIRNTAGDNVAHWAHLGGALVGFLLVYFWNRPKGRRHY